MCENGIGTGQSDGPDGSSDRQKEVPPLSRYGRAPCTSKGIKDQVLPPGLSRVIGVTKGAAGIWSAEVCDAVAILECTRWSLKPGATWPKGQQWWAQETD